MFCYFCDKKESGKDTEIIDFSVDDGDFNYSNINSISPLQTMGIHCLVDCSSEIETSDNPLELTIKLRDGKEYLYTVR